MDRSKTFFRGVVCAAVLAWTVAPAAPAHAYRMIQNPAARRVSAGQPVACRSAGGFAHWDTRNIKWYLNPEGQGEDKAPALAAAMRTWTQVPNAGHALTYEGTTTAGFATDNRNTVVFAAGNGCTGSCLAVTALVLKADQVIVETDISFNANFQWRTDGADHDTQSTATHELGHTLGVHHTERTATPRPTMYAIYFGTGARTLEADDKAALQCAEGRY